MAYTPTLPVSGLGGWRFLQRTMDRQMAAHSGSAEVKRELAYFKENIGKADTADKLVADRRLLSVALGAFGLGEEVNKKAFIRKMLEEGTDNRRSFANRIVDPRWREFVGAFGYGDRKGAQVGKESFVKDVMRSFEVKGFEEALGAVDNSQRIALNFDRQAKTLALIHKNDAKAGKDTGWLKMLGDKPMRALLEKALGLPKEFAKINLDQQIVEIKDKMTRLIGTDDIGALLEDGNRDKLIRRYFVRQSLENGPSPFTPGASALAVLRAGGAGANNLFQSLLR